MTLLIIGADGQLGSDYVRLAAELLGHRTVNLFQERFDVSSRDDVFSTLERLEFDVIVNTSAYHGPEAYRDGSPETHLAVNAAGPYYLAQFAEEHGKVLVHFSTDYVFSGNAPPERGAFSEEDRPRPANLYGASKLAGEGIIPCATDRYFIFRIASLYGSRGCKAKQRANFVELVIRKLQNGESMEVVDDIVMSPTSTRSVVLKTIQVIGSDAFGLYHLAGSGRCSWYDLAVASATSLGLPVERIRRSSSETVGQAVQRGKNTALRNERLTAGGFGEMPHWKTNLEDYLREREIVGTGEVNS